MISPSREKVEGLLVALARAAHQALEDSEEDQHGVVTLDPKSHAELQDALAALEELPAPPDGQLYTGPAAAEWWLEQFRGA